MNITRQDLNRQYKHIGNVRHGVQTGPWRVEFSAPVDETDLNLANLVQGSIISLNSDGKFIVGCPAGSGANQPVPFLCMKNLFDTDVTTGIGGLATDTWTTTETVSGTATAVVNTAAHGAPYRTYSAEGGKVVGIPLTCGYELETTEFDASATYNVNDGLIPDTNTVGKLTVATAAPASSTVPYLGFVSLKPHKDYFNGERIAFFANFIPALA